MKAWAGRAAQAARTYMAPRLPAPCGKCAKPVTADQAWVVGHVKDRATYPELTWEPSNWQHEHRACSDRSSQAVVQDKARREGWELAGRDRADFPAGGGARTAPPRPTPPIAPSGALTIPERLLWAPSDLAATPWLHGLLEVPGDASPPLAMTPPHPDAVGSYGPEAVAWVERTQQITLRWWQRLAIVRQLEHDASGRLVWRVVVESAPRRSGKSVRLRGVALWRLAHGAELFGEPQLVLHTGKDVAIVREIQKAAWRWSEGEAGWKVGRGRGSEQIETPDGDRWLAKAKDAVYGFDVGLGMVDEAWGVDPDVADEGLEPATLERLSPQLHLTSTAHRRSTSLMRRRIGDALAADDGETLLLLWAAAPGSDPGDPETWRAASPHWSEDRARRLAARHAKALAGEADPEADDLDPMAGFEAQYLNRWQLRATPTVVGSAVVTEADWRALGTDLPASSPDAAAVEGWPGQGLSVARAWRIGACVGVSVVDVADVAAAAALVHAWGARRVVVGASLAEDPAWRGVRVTSASGAVRGVVADLTGLLRDGVLRHDDGAHLTGQVLGLRTSPGADGLRLRSSGRADAVKACCWAAAAARRASSGRPRVLVAP